MEIKITSSHKTEGNTPVKDFFVSIAEFYIGVNVGRISLRTNVHTTDENGVEYPFDLLPTDPLAPCLNQELLISEYAQRVTEITLTGTEYEIEAQLIFSLIFNKITAVNTVTPGKITYQLIGF